MGVSTAPARDRDAAGSGEPLLRIEDLCVSFESRSGVRNPAVQGVGLSVHAGQTVALVGESGCGKSVTALSVLRLLPTPPARIERGRVLLRGEGSARDVLTMGARDLRRVRGGEAAMIFQEPMTSLNPVLTVGDQVLEAVRLHRGLRGEDARREVTKAMEAVGISDASRRMRAYPHEFSGGMRQRVMIAIALACEPRLLLADEPTTALDATIQAQILDLLRRLRAERGMSMLLISHDLGVVANHADVVNVMYGGRIVECARTADLFASPAHPYTRALLACAPSLRERRRRLTVVAERVADPASFADLGGLGEGAIGWWPRHSPPTPEHRYALCTVGDGHWAAAWWSEGAPAGLTPATGSPGLLPDDRRR